MLALQRRARYLREREFDQSWGANDAPPRSCRALRRLEGTAPMASRMVIARPNQPTGCSAEVLVR